MSKKALVVGINDYSTMSPLHGCVNDAIAISDMLKRDGDGSPNFGVDLLTSPETPVDRKRLRKAVEALWEGPNDIALFFFAGHGVIRSTGGYVCTKDSEKYDEGISMDDILKLANRSKAKEKIVILDCCHSGAFANPDFGGSSVAELSDGLTVMAASRDTEVAQEEKGAGVFTTLVTQAMNGGAADLMGNITPGSVYSFVDRALGPWDQRPIFKTNVSRFSPLRKVEPGVPAATLRKLTDLFKAPTDDFALDPEYEEDSGEATEAKLAVMRDLRLFAQNALVVPVDREYMYHAAMESTGCRLTPLGQHYWQLVKKDKI